MGLISGTHVEQTPEKIAAYQILKIVNNRLAQEKGSPTAELINLKKIAENIRSCERIMGNCQRHVEKVSDAEGNVIFIKKPDYFSTLPNHVQRMTTNIPNDELAYIISELFKLHVVPYTICDQSTTIAKGVGVNPEGENHKDIYHLTKVLLFNIITGRQDAGSSNSVWTFDGKLFEIDNEEIGKRSTSSWVFEILDDNTLVDQNLLKQIVSVDEKTITDLSAKYSSQTVLAIESNLKHLKWLVQQNEKLSVKDLKTTCYGFW
jgi:hypothetical protein